VRRIDVLDRWGLFLAAAALVAVAAAPTALAQGDRPFGLIGPIDGGNAASGVVALAGWALDDDGVDSVDVLVDGVVVGRALYGAARPDVAIVHPGFPNAGNAGFVFELDTTRFVNGLHVVGGLIEADNGERGFLTPMVLEVMNASALLAPFGEIRHPLPNAELFGNCNLADPQRRSTVVRGFALDVGMTDDDTGVGYLELLVDGVIQANTKTDCAFTPATGGWTSCYGIRDFGLEQVFPGVFNAPHGGFRFVLDVGALIADLGYAEGVHQIGIRAGDLADQVAVIDTLPVTFRCDDDLDEDAFGSIDLPVEGGFFGGVVMVTGWALDPDGVTQVQVFVDGSFVGNATHGFSRPEVAADHPGLPQSASAGWSFPLDTRGLSDGHHQLQLVVVDPLGRSTVIGERPFLVENAPHGPSLAPPIGVTPANGGRTRSVTSIGAATPAGG
jgi:N-acetylmuramoyl-L-alanine amidase